MTDQDAEIAQLKADLAEAQISRENAWDLMTDAVKDQIATAFHEGFWAGDAAHESKESIADTRSAAFAAFQRGWRYGTSDQAVSQDPLVTKLAALVQEMRARALAISAIPASVQSAKGKADSHGQETALTWAADQLAAVLPEG